MEVGWARATRLEARDFSCWILLAVKQGRQAATSGGVRWASGAVAPDPVTGKPALGDG